MSDDDRLDEDRYVALVDVANWARSLLMGKLDSECVGMEHHLRAALRRLEALTTKEPS